MPVFELAVSHGANSPTPEKISKARHFHRTPQARNIRMLSLRSTQTPRARHVSGYPTAPKQARITISDAPVRNLEKYKWHGANPDTRRPPDIISPAPAMWSDHSTATPDKSKPLGHDRNYDAAITWRIRNDNLKRCTRTQTQKARINPHGSKISDKYNSISGVRTKAPNSPRFLRFI